MWSAGLVNLLTPVWGSVQLKQSLSVTVQHSGKVTWVGLIKSVLVNVKIFKFQAMDTVGPAKCLEQLPAMQESSVSAQPTRGTVTCPSWQERIPDSVSLWASAVNFTCPAGKRPRRPQQSCGLSCTTAARSYPPPTPIQIRVSRCRRWTIPGSWRAPPRRARIPPRTPAADA